MTTGKTLLPTSKIHNKIFHFSSPVSSIPTSEYATIMNIIHTSKPYRLATVKRGPLSAIKNAMKTENKLDFIPPSNSIIVNTLSHRRISSALAAAKEGVDRSELLPANFTWVNNPLIESASSQGVCGSCWAFASCGMFSDLISIATEGKIKPHLSPTYLLSCRQQLGCGGGFPTDAINDIVSVGLVGNDCIDYGWCKRNSICDGNALNHFSNPTEYLNSKIPACANCNLPEYTAGGQIINPSVDNSLPQCETSDYYKEIAIVKCLQKDGRVNKYFGKNPYSVYATTNSDGDVNGNELENVIYDIREHLIHKGSVMGAYLILTNFMGEGTGLFKETNGIYIDTYPYKGPNGVPVIADNSDAFNPTPFAIAGGHAVVIVGWGEMQVDAINPQTDQPYGLVQYWDVRNSWGSNWGDNGFFKMATYPTNKFSQFDVGINVGADEKGNIIWLGGFSLIEFDRIETRSVDGTEITYVNDEYDAANYPIPDRELEPVITQWHAGDENIINEEKPTQEIVGKSNKTRNILFILFLLLILGIVIYILWKRRNP